MVQKILCDRGRRQPLLLLVGPSQRTAAHRGLFFNRCPFSLGHPSLAGWSEILSICTWNGVRDHHRRRCLLCMSSQVPWNVNWVINKLEISYRTKAIRRFFSRSLRTIFPPHIFIGERLEVALLIAVHGQKILSGHQSSGTARGNGS